MELMADDGEVDWGCCGVDTVSVNVYADVLGCVAVGVDGCCVC